MALLRSCSPEPPILPSKQTDNEPTLPLDYRNCLARTSAFPERGIRYSEESSQ